MTLEEIAKLRLCQELRKPAFESQKFINSDVNALEKNLAQNEKVLDVTFDVVNTAMKDYPYGEFTIPL